MASPEYDAKLKEVSATIMARIRAEKDKIAVTHKLLEPIDVQLEAWKTMPKEQALKEALALFKSHGLDVPETRLKLEILKFISEIQGAMIPQQDKSHRVVALRVNFINFNNQHGQSIQLNQAIDVESQVIE